MDPQNDICFFYAAIKFQTIFLWQHKKIKFINYILHP